MKLEIEITEANIKKAIERKIRVALADEVGGWNADNYIRESVKKHWKEVADKTIKDACNDAPALRQKIMVTLENKIKGQLASALKVNAK